MEIEVLEERDNVLLKRKEIKLGIKHAGSPTPKKQDLIKEIAARYSISEDHVIVDYIFTKKGLQESFAKVKIYQELPKAKKKEEVKELPKAEQKEEVKSEAQTGEAK
ncbi:MAG: hypothetical protein QW423_01660 [Candidatus Aenigmatarchaeota archaeon]